jgi:hypothetical protein
LCSRNIRDDISSASTFGCLAVRKRLQRSATIRASLFTRGVRPAWSLSQVEFEGLLPAVALDADEFAVDNPAPLAETMDLAADLLLPRSAGVRVSGKSGHGFSSLRAAAVR